MRFATRLGVDCLDTECLCYSDDKVRFHCDVLPFDQHRSSASGFRSQGSGLPCIFGLAFPRRLDFGQRPCSDFGFPL